MLAKKKHKELIASTEDRINNVKDILRIIRKDIELCVVPMSDAFGPTITEEKIEALVVSAETMAGGNAGMNDNVEESIIIININVLTESY
jgi:pantetheine-phosphate adenylyltransferase